MHPITYCLPLLETRLPALQYQAQVRRVLQSLVNQSVPYWQCHIVVRAELTEQLKELVAKLLADNQSAVRFSNDPVDATEAISIQSKRFLVHSTLNDAVANAAHLVANIVTRESSQDNEPSWLVVLRDDTQLASHATYTYLSTGMQNPEAKLIYGDHDQIDSQGVRQNPFFKPEFSLDLLYSQNYLGPIFALQARYIVELQNEKLENNQSYALATILEVIRSLTCDHFDQKKPLNFRKYLLHVPSVLHHHEAEFSQSVQQPNVKKIDEQLWDERSQGNLKLLKEHFENLLSHPSSSPLHDTNESADTLQYQPVASVTEVKPFVYRSAWSITGDLPLVSLIIPTRDGYEILKACLDSILTKTTYLNYEIFIVNNQSKDPKTIEFLSAMATLYENIRVLNYDAEFNYSAINNYAVKHAAGSVIGFVNNDIEVISTDWLNEMVGHVLRQDVGCVGAMHFYPDDTIQHAGVIVGLDGVAGHAFRFENKSSNEDYFNYFSSIRNPDAVTAATLLIRKELFERVGGFDEMHLAIAFNDVDLCLKVNALGYRCVWTPYAELYHHESKTRRLTPSLEAAQREMYEHAVMKERWGTDVYTSRELLKYKKVVA
jgi:GT2 family glycosyltransferase